MRVNWLNWINSKIFTLVSSCLVMHQHCKITERKLFQSQEACINIDFLKSSLSNAIYRDPSVWANLNWFKTKHYNFWKDVILADTLKHLFRNLACFLQENLREKQRSILKTDYLPHVDVFSLALWEASEFRLLLLLSLNLNLVQSKLYSHF